MAKLTPRKIAQLCKLLKRTGGDVKASCAAVGISTTIFYKWKQKDKKLALAFEDARHELNMEAEYQLYNNMKKGNQRAIEFILINTMPHKWKHITKAIMGNVDNDLDGFTNDELIENILKLAKGMDDVNLADYGFQDIEDIDHEEVENNENLELPANE